MAVSNPGSFTALTYTVKLDLAARRNARCRSNRKEVIIMKRRVWGVLFLVLGVLVLIQVTGVYDLGLAFWPVVLLFLGLVILWESIDHGFVSWITLGLGLWVGGIGLFGILSNAGASTLTGSDIARYGWPLLLVGIGLSILIGEKACFVGRFWSGSEDGEDSWKSNKSMRHIGDLYHGRTSWVLDQDQEFYHGIGDVVIDLTTAEIIPGSHRIYVKAGIGEVTIRVPDGVNLDIDASVGIGELDLFGEQRSGFTGLSLHRDIIAEGAEASVKIESKLGIGDLKVLYMPVPPGVSR